MSGPGRSTGPARSGAQARSGRSRAGRARSVRSRTGPASATVRRIGRHPARPRPVEGGSPRLRSRLARQVAVLGVVLLAVGLVLAFPFRDYLAAQADLAAQQAQEASLRADLAALQEQKQALSDPDYLIQQARSRRQYVMPGDTAYVVHVPATAAAPAAPAPAATSDVPWYSRLWDTLGDQAAARR